MWLVHIIIFMLCSPPRNPFLNKIFIDLDNAWGELLQPFLTEIRSSLSEASKIPQEAKDFSVR